MLDALTKFLARSTITLTTRKKSNEKYAITSIPKPIVNRYDLKDGDRLVFFDLPAYMDLSPNIQDKYEWLYVAIEKGEQG